jgi:hypothetical protein
MTHWGDKHRPNANGERLVFVERNSNKPIRRMSATSEDGRALRPREIRALAGPALDENARVFLMRTYSASLGSD